MASRPHQRITYVIPSLSESIMADHSCRISRGRRFAVVALALAALATSLVATAFPVFPGAVGFGTNTKAGRDAADDALHIYKVTTLVGSLSPHPGSLRYGIEGVTGPRVI